MAKYTFNVYIDESGDEGFSIKDGKWVSSRWFIIGALITHKASDLPISKTVDAIKLKFNWKNNKPLHFIDFSHEKRSFIINSLTSNSGFRVCYVAFDKQKIPEDSFLRKKRYLYNYCTRYLLERISWMVDDLQGEAHLIFENRSSTSYSELNEYITETLSKGKSQIRQGVFKTWKNLGKSQSKNLQLADAVVSSLYKALEPNQYGLTEDSYIEALRPFIYNSNGNYHAYGLKVFPNSFRDLQNEHRWIRMFTKEKSVL
ncbi:DUF3800 domain-containing protein [Paenibacillus campinasensis]|uniref:DUF3800 domain-containing protein n=1 Tax=Paenibacillus campinasensis TaxID=66347 RepID=A0A268EKJ4_9BACL|nr:DUF3800 domain-containing protein [Paenibacillus campinasensis]PAD73656.1 hypothetical protein CHH67_19660 [Paenibacillus campinasensis]